MPKFTLGDSIICVSKSICIPFGTVGKIVNVKPHGVMVSWDAGFNFLYTSLGNKNCWFVSFKSIDIIFQKSKQDILLDKVKEIFERQPYYKNLKGTV